MVVIVIENTIFKKLTKIIISKNSQHTNVLK